eukprot:12887270-Prorocentrum_lima.AAC.1
MGPHLAAAGRPAHCHKAAYGGGAASWSNRQAVSCRGAAVGTLCMGGCVWQRKKDGVRGGCWPL